MSDTLVKAGKFALLGPIGYLLTEGLQNSSKDMTTASAQRLEQLKEEAAKQEIMMDFQQHQAKVAQELAIAERISRAAEVEIEEYYDLSGSAEAGVSGSPTTSSISVGAKGEGRKVTKRIYRFRGTVASEDL